MISVLLSVTASIFIFACLINLAPALKAFRGSVVGRQRVLLAAWAAMFVGQLQLFSHDGTAAESLQGGHLYQLLWMFVAAILLLQLVLTARILPHVWKFPLIAFLAYCFVAVASVAFSPSKALSLYKASQIIMDAALVIICCSELIRRRKPELIVNASVGLLALLLLAVTIGGVVAPEQAFKANEGAVGVSLRGVVPSIHQNELGLMSAVGMLVGLLRAAGSSSGARVRFFWAAVALMGATVLFLAQARTSLAAAAIALIMSGFLVRKLRWISVGVFVSAFALFIYYQLAGSQLGFEDTVERYVTRGTSDEQMQTLSGRTELWRIGMQMFRDAPMFGHGFAAGVRVSGTRYGLPEGTNMHSAHMQVLVDMGAVGYLVWLSFVLGVAVVVFKAMRRSVKVRADGYLAVEAMLIVFVIFFRSFLGHVLVAHQPNIMIFMSVYIFAVVRLALYRMPDRASEAAKTEAAIGKLLPAARPRLLSRKA